MNHSSSSIGDEDRDSLRVPSPLASTVFHFSSTDLKALDRSVSPCEVVSPQISIHSQSELDHLPSLLSRINDQIDLKVASSKNPTAILELDMDGNVRYLSKNWESIVGTKISKILNKPVSNIIIGDDNDSMIFNNAVKQMATDDVSYKVKFITATNDVSDSNSEEDQEGRITPNNSFEDLNEVLESPQTDVDEDMDTHSATSSEMTTNGEIIELEGQGILIHDASTHLPTHSMWMLKPFIPVDLELRLSQKLIDNLGFGSEIFESYLYNLNELGIFDEDSVPVPKQILCRICEQTVPAWWLEKHSEMCIVEHRAEEELTNSHEALLEQKKVILKIAESINNSSNSNSVLNSPMLSPALSSPILSTVSGTSSSGSYFSLDTSNYVTEYKGLPLPSPATPTDASPRLVTQVLKKSINIPKRPSALSSRRFPFKTLSLLVDLCDEALSINPGELDNLSSENIHFSPHTERAIKNVMSWEFLESSDQTIKLLVEDTEKLAQEKINAIFRLISALQYSEKIKRETDELVLETVKETVKLIREQTNSNTVGVSESISVDFNSGNTTIDNVENTLSVSSGLSPNYSRSNSSSSLSSKNVKNSTILHSPQPSRAKSPPMFTDMYLSNDTLPLNYTRLSSPLSVPYKRSTNSGSITPNEISIRGRTPTVNSSRHDSGELVEGINDLDINSGRRSTKNSYSSPRRHLSPAPNYVSHSPMSSVQRNQVTFSNTPVSSPFLSATSDSYFPDSLERRRSSHEKNRPPLSPLLISTPSVKPSTPTIRDYEILKAISKGAFGSVYLAKRKLTGDYFAIKALKKSDMIAKNQVTNVISERAVMMRQADSPYVAKLYSSFQTKDYLFLVMEYLSGGDCATLLKMLGHLDVQWSKRYIAEVIVGVDHLHQKGIIHRDLKPDNLLIDSKGHIKLTDFGLSRMGIINRQATHERKTSTTDSAIDWLNSSINNPHGAGGSLGQNSSTPIPKRKSSITAFSLSPGVDGTRGTPDGMETGSPIYNFIENFRERTGSGMKSGRSGSNTSSIDSPLVRPLIARTSSETSFAIIDDDVPSHAPIINSLALYDPENNVAKKFVGTPDYLAPETIEGLGQSEASDWWSIGCILFEFLFGYPPFHASTPDQVFQNILAGYIDWPELQIEEELDLCPDEARDLISQLLSLDPDERLGSQGAQEIMDHPFFDGVHWDTLFEEQPSFVPEVDDPTSTEYFDSRGADITNFPMDEDSDEDEKKQRHNSNTIITTTNLGSPSIPINTSPGSGFGTPINSRDRRGSRMSESNEFGSFQFRNLAVLEKANKDVINRLKSEHLEHRNSMSSSSSESLTGNKPRTRGLSFNSTNPFKRPISPSHNSPSRSNNQTPTRQERVNSTNSVYSSGDEAVLIDSDRSSPNLVESSSSQNNTSSSSFISNVNKTSNKPPPIHIQGHRSSTPTLSKQVLSRSITDFSPSSSDTEDSKSSALLRVRKRRQSSRKTGASVPGERSGSLELQFERENVSFHELDVLVCDPIPIVRYTIQQLLEKLGCIVVAVSNGDELVRRVTGEVKFDMIFTALKIPNLGAIDVAKLIKYTASVNSNTPFVAITVYAKEAQQSGAFDYVIEKPIALNTLSACLAKFCSWKPPNYEEEVLIDSDTEASK